MKIKYNFYLILSFTALLYSCSGNEKQEFVSLFNGEDLENWTVKCKPGDKEKNFWFIEEGTITANSIGDSLHDYIWLQSAEEYSDFHLIFKFQAYQNSPGNSGVQIRSRYDEEAFWLNGPQIDIHPPGNWRTGMMWDETRGNQRWIYPDIPAGEWVDPSMVKDPVEFYYAGETKAWNEMEIVARGMKIKAYLNGKQITDFDGEGILNDELHKKYNVGEKGYICFQIHTGDQLKIRYKDVYIKVLN